MSLSIKGECFYLPCRVITAVQSGCLIEHPGSIKQTEPLVKAVSGSHNRLARISGGGLPVAQPRLKSLQLSKYCNWTAELECPESI